MPALALAPHQLGVPGAPVLAKRPFGLGRAGEGGRAGTGLLWNQGGYGALEKTAGHVYQGKLGPPVERIE